jgi:hypothetical protein
VRLKLFTKKKDSVMKLSRILPLVVGGAAALSVAFPQEAKALTFNWSFNPTSGGVVSGQVSGLNIGSNPVSAATVTLTSSPGNVGLGTYSRVAAGRDQDWIVNSGGNVTSASWLGTLNGFNLFIGTNPWTGSGTTYYPQLVNSSLGLDYNNQSVGATFTPVPFDIPGGATIPTVGSLFALGLMRKAKRSLALKTRIANPLETVVL